MISLFSLSPPPPSSTPSTPTVTAPPRHRYTTAVADLMHVGHAKLFQACRQFGDELIVGVHSDAVVAGYKRAPVFSEDDRYFLVGE